MENSNHSAIVIFIAIMILKDDSSSVVNFTNTSVHRICSFVSEVGWVVKETM